MPLGDRSTTASATSTRTARVVGHGAQRHGASRRAVAGSAKVRILCRNAVVTQTKVSKVKNHKKPDHPAPARPSRCPKEDRMTVVRAALVQTNWTGDKESMIVAHEEYARQAAAQGAQVICFQELFYGPYFCQVQDKQYYEYAESIPGPTTERFQALAKELDMVMVLPMYEQEQPGILYNTAAVVDADGTLPRQVPQAAHPARERLLGEVLLPSRQRRLPGVRHRGRQDRRLHLLRPPLPRGLARPRPQRRADRVQPVRHLARPVPVPVEHRAAGRRRRERVLRRARSTASASRTSATTTSTASPTSSTPRATTWARRATRTSPS